MRRTALLAFLVLAGCARAPGGAERVVSGTTVVGDTAEWTAHFAGDTLRKIEERSHRGDHTAKNVYWYEAGALRLYDSQRDRGMHTLHVLFDSAGHVTKFSKREDGRAVAIEPAEAQEALVRGAYLAVKAHRAAGVTP